MRVSYSLYSVFRLEQNLNRDIHDWGMKEIKMIRKLAIGLHGKVYRHIRLQTDSTSRFCSVRQRYEGLQKCSRCLRNHREILVTLEFHWMIVDNKFKKVLHWRYLVTMDYTLLLRVQTRELLHWDRQCWLEIQEWILRSQSDTSTSLQGPRTLYYARGRSARWKLSDRTGDRRIRNFLWRSDEMAEVRFIFQRGRK